MNTPTRVLVLLVLGLVFSSKAAAQEPASSFVPPQLESSGRDWVKMSSGEWLMGDVKGLRDDDFSFDSEDLDDLDLDWDDVAELYSPRILTYVFEDKIVLSGKGVIRADEIVIDDGMTEHHMKRSDLLGIIEGEQKEINYWSLKLGLGFVGRSGNTDQSDINTVLRIKRESALTRLMLNYEGNYGKLNGQESVNNQRASAALDFFLYRNLFITVPAVDYYNDTFHHALALLSVEIWNDDLKLETSLTWDRVESPRPNEDGVVPLRDDFRTYVGFSLDL